MNEAQHLESTVSEYHKLHQLMMKTTLRTDDGWKREFIDLRQQLQALLTKLAALSNRLERSELDAGLSAQFRDSLSRMRHVAALHQADWPVVRIDSKDPGYRASNEGVRVASQNFLAAADRVLKALRGNGTDQKPGS
jgi:hypothetical protein